MKPAAIPALTWRTAVALAFLLALLPPLAWGKGNSCLDCHASATKMAALGYAHFTVTAAEVKAQSGMTADCPDCHLGNPDSTEKEKAHKGMGRLLIVRKKGLKAETAERKYPLEFGAEPMNRIKYVADKDGKPAVDPTVAQILYQDKRPDTLSQDFAMMEKTCGACHKKEFDEFRKSAMGQNAKQSQYRSWTDKERGPHNCGVWSEPNYAKITATTTVPFSREQSALNQRSCATCHVGCLDCHYAPMASDPAKPRQGMHTFNRRPAPQNCYGGGRGTLCHAGPEERRRGAGYFGASYAYPEGSAPDVHATKNVGCLDCHETSGVNPRLGHGTVRRSHTRCFDCHLKAVEGLRYTVHKSLTCEACHVQEVGGYQATFWGPGTQAGTATPFYKYKEYYGIMKEPILIKDESRLWIPVKPYPMAVMNQQGDYAKPLRHWRYPTTFAELERTNDAWGYVGLFGGLPENNQALLWVQMDKVSHKYGKSRSCASCHELRDGEQRQTVTWDYSDAGALPFSGSHTVVGNRAGLYIREMKARDRIEVLDGFRLSSFAPWVYLPDKWVVRGDFSIPPIKDKKRYEEAKQELAKARQSKVIHGK
ncbi:MAG TPA: cytochrome c3 family protein [Geobacteraceae bacterium]